MSDTWDINSAYITLADAHVRYQTYASSSITPAHFHEISTKLGINKSSRKHSPRYYFAVDRANISQGKLTARNRLPRPVDITVFNSRGLIIQGQDMDGKEGKGQDAKVTKGLNQAKATGRMGQAQNKCPFVHNLLPTTHEHILSVTESWLNKSVHEEGEITSTFNEHHIHRTDRDTSLAAEGENGEKYSGGGCLTITSNPLPISNVIEFSNGVCELQINYIHTINVILVNIYRPPDSHLSKFREIVNKVKSYLSTTSIIKPIIIVTGDFNFPPDVVTWKKVDDVVIPLVKAGKSQTKLALQDLLDLADDFFLSQTINLPTRKNNILDLCFTSDPQSIINVESIPVPNYISDHNMLRIITSYTTDTLEVTLGVQDTPEIAQLNYEKADQVDLSNILKTVLGENPGQYDTLSPANHKSLLEAKILEAANSLPVPM